VGLLLAAIPFGTVCGAIGYGRFTPPTRRWRSVPAMALLSCAGLVPIILDPPLPIVLLLLAVAGYGSAYQIALNARGIVAMLPLLRRWNTVSTTEGPPRSKPDMS
jgi:hypothetical protein